MWGFGLKTGIWVPLTVLWGKSSSSGTLHVQASPIRRGWFYHERDDKSTKSLDYLVDCYFSTVGQNSNVLPNLSPNKEGIIPEADARRIIQFGRVIEKMKKNDLAKGARAKALSGWTGNPDSGLLFDNNPLQAGPLPMVQPRRRLKSNCPEKKSSM